MKVAVIPSDTGACGHFRLVWPAEAVRSVRPDWQVDIYHPKAVQIAAGPKGLAVRGLDLEGLDLAVFQRIGTTRQVELVRAVQAAGIAVAIDVDDALYCIDPDSGSYAAWNGRHSPTHWSNLEEATRRADLVTVTTDALALHYAKHSRVERIVNGLPEFAYQDEPPVRVGEPVTVGWSGVAASHAHDLEVVGPALAKIMADSPDVYLRVVGDAQWAAGVLQVPEDRLIDAGLHPLSGYHAALRGTDVGIVPLEDTPFNRAKSALKALEFTAAGAHVVASPTPANAELAITTHMSLAKTPDGWEHALRQSLAAVRYYREYGGLGVVDVRHMGILPRAEEWAQAWERAINRRKNLTTKKRR